MGKVSMSLLISFSRYQTNADLSTLTVSPCVTWFHCLSQGLTVGSSFLTVLQILSGLSLKLTVFSENKQRQHNPPSKNIVAWSSTYKKTNK